MPLFLKHLIFYDRIRVQSIRREWPFRIFSKYLGVNPKFRVKNRLALRYRKKALYALALDYERNQNNFDTLRQLRKDSGSYSDKIDYRRCKELANAEKFDFESREKNQNAYYLKHLKKQKYG